MKFQSSDHLLLSIFFSELEAFIFFKKKIVFPKQVDFFFKASKWEIWTNLKSMDQTEIMICAEDLQWLRGSITFEGHLRYSTSRTELSPLCRGQSRA